MDAHLDRKLIYNGLPLTGTPDDKRKALDVFYDNKSVDQLLKSFNLSTDGTLLEKRQRYLTYIARPELGYDAQYTLVADKVHPPMIIVMYRDFITAIQNNDLAKVKKLLHQGVDPNTLMNIINHKLNIHFGPDV